MIALIMTILIFLVLLLGIFYYRALHLEDLQKKTELDQQIKKFLLIPLLLTVVNLISLKLSSATELIIVTLLLWLNIIFFFILLIKYYSPSKAILLATGLSQVLILVVYLTNLEVVNNVLLILAYIAAVTLVFKRLRLADSIWISLLVFMTILDAILIWLVPVIPTVEAQVQPLLFSLLVKVGNISLGAGDVVFLLLAVLVLAKHFSRKVVIWQVLILSLAIPVALLIQNFLPDSTTSFPFLVVLTPIFLILYWLAKIISKNQKNTL